MLRNRKNATVLAEKIKNLYAERATYKFTQFLITKDTLRDLDAEVLAEVINELIDDGTLVTPENTGEYILTGRPDGRRSRREYPDVLTGWQFLGQVSDDGKPPAHAPRWVNDYFRFDPNTGLSHYKSNRSILTIDVHVGDWIVKDNNSRYAGSPDRFVLTSANIDRWYDIRKVGTPHPSLHSRVMG